MTHTCRHIYQLDLRVCIVFVFAAFAFVLHNSHNFLRLISYKTKPEGIRSLKMIYLHARVGQNSDGHPFKSKPLDVKGSQAGS